MAKRIVTRIGDVFCVKLPDNTKGYFQYVANDMAQMNSSVIRAFYTHYPMDAAPRIEDIIKDKVQFYAHTVVSGGILPGAWEKVGTSREIDEESVHRVIFGNTSEFDLTTGDIKFVDPRTNWYLWRIGTDRVKVGKLPDELLDMIYTGSVKPYCEIIDRMYYGYYRYTMPEYKVLRRIPRPDVHSYVKFEENGRIIYLCFWGDELEKGVIVDKGGDLKFSAAVNPQVFEEFRKKIFSDYYWEHKNFITEDEFVGIWDSREKE